MERMTRVPRCTFISQIVLLLCLTPIGFILIVTPLNAAYTNVYTTPYDYEADLYPGAIGTSVSNQENIMDYLYGSGNYTRIDDTYDQLWLNSGNAKVKAVAKFGGSSEVGLWYNDGSPIRVIDWTTYESYMTDTWHDLPNNTNTFYWELNEDPDPENLGTKYSVETMNPSSMDQMVTFRVNADANNPERWVLAWEEGTFASWSDWDYQDMVFEVIGAQPLPEPSTFVLLFMGAAGLVFYAHRRLRL